MSRRFRQLVLLRIIVPLLRNVASLFFDSRYLRGKHFDRSLVGWMWVWRSFWTQKFLGINRHIPWPVSHSIAIDNPDRVMFDLDDMNNFWTFGCYFSNANQGNITIGKGTWIGPNVGIVTTNHDPENPERHHKPRDITIGRQCWIGMNSMIMPGVVLGDHTVVAAGAVVTKSFPDGSCIVAGVPATVIRQISRSGKEQTTA